jgi:chemotaxis protein MotB
MTTVGHGGSRPVVPHWDLEERWKNRRVEFVLETGGDYRQELPFLVDSSDQLPF